MAHRVDISEKISKKAEHEIARLKIRIDEKDKQIDKLKKEFDKIFEEIKKVKKEQE